MKMEEERKLRYKISLILNTKPAFVTIDKTEEMGGNKRKIYATVRGYKYGVLMDGARIEQTWRVVA